MTLLNKLQSMRTGASTVGCGGQICVVEFSAEFASDSFAAEHCPVEEFKLTATISTLYRVPRVATEDYHAEAEMAAKLLLTHIVYADVLASLDLLTSLAIGEDIRGIHEEINNLREKIG